MFPPNPGSRRADYRTEDRGERIRCAMEIHPAMFRVVDPRIKLRIDRTHPGRSPAVAQIRPRRKGLRFQTRERWLQERVHSKDQKQAGYMTFHGSHGLAHQHPDRRLIDRHGPVRRCRYAVPYRPEISNAKRRRNCSESAAGWAGCKPQSPLQTSKADCRPASKSSLGLNSCPT